MPRTDHPPEETENNVTEEIKTRVAAKVREDSQNLAKLTSLQSLDALITDLDTDNVQVDLSEMIDNDEYHDIKLVATATGAVYLYSETYITRNEAGILARAEEIQTGIAEKVREDSQNLAKLTAVDSLGTLVSDLEPDEVETNLAEMAKDERFQDIISMTASTGAVYLYSETYITENYARILARVEADDPGATIAATVRENSRMYPRPTNIELFKERVFNIDPNELETFIAHTLEQQEFQDIKLIHASTGTRYLYSTLHITEDYARSLVEWAEVEEDENP